MQADAPPARIVALTGSPVLAAPDVDAGSRPMAAEGPEPSAEVHAAGTYARARFRWGYFLLLNAIAAAIAVALFIGIAHGERLDPYLLGTYLWLLAHPAVTSVMAFSPLASAMLVGWGYSQRARKRKAAAAVVLARSAERASAADA